MNHVLSSDQYTREKLDELFKLADDIIANPKKYSKVLEGKLISVIFYEPSTRTRLSFETAVYRLGGNILTTENAKEFSSTIKGESLEDTIRVLQKYADAIVMRHFEVDSATRAASVAKVPILNAGSGSGEHPTQSLLDMYTIKKSKKNIDGLKVAVLGDLKHGRTVHSLIKLLSQYKDITIYGLSKENVSLPQEYIDMLEKRSTKYIKCLKMEELPRDLDVIYHTRMQAERANEDLGKEEFIINKQVLDTFSKDTIILHPLPRNIEISTDVDDDPRALYFEQAGNGVPIRMALLIKSFEN